MCLHPERHLVLYNIALSYERLLQFERAIAYYERYVLSKRGTTAADALERRQVAARVEVLKALPARIQVDHRAGRRDRVVHRRVRGPARAARSRAEPFEVIAGEYTMIDRAAGLRDRSTRTIVAEIGQPYSYFFQLEPSAASW